MVNAKWEATPRSHYSEFVFTDDHVNHDLLANGGVIKRAIVNAGLENLIFKHRKYINPVGVVDFLSNLKTKNPNHKDFATENRCRWSHSFSGD